MGVYDVIVVGGRVAGAATAMLLARAGVRVLCVDRARFPSDTLSTHQIQVPGAARLHRWGLLEPLVAAGAPAGRRARLDTEYAVLEGDFPAVDGVDTLLSPRRTVLDALLVNAARAAGAEVREGFTVESLCFDDDPGTGVHGARVTGIRGKARDGGATVTEYGRLVVGADGKHSLVAAAVGAAGYRTRPAATFCAYTYFEGVESPIGLLYQRARLAAPAFPTNDGLSMLAVIQPLSEFDAYRADPAGHFHRALDRCGDLGARARAGSRVERLRATPDLPNTFRVPYGPGWALAGDAGLVMDPITAQGIGNAFRDADLLAEAITAGLDGKVPLATALAGYHRSRDAVSMPMYDFTAELAAFAPPTARQRLLYRALRGRPAEIQRFLGMFCGAIPIPDYFGARSLLKTLSGAVRPLPRTDRR